MSAFSSPKLARQHSEQVAEDVISKHKLTALPIDPCMIAAKSGLLIKPMSLQEPGISGVFMKHGDNFGIGYSTRIKNEGFMNFTIAHELGHYFLPGHVEYLFGDGQNVHYSMGEFLSGDPREKEADYFAAALLMPKGLFVTAMRTAGKGFAAINRLKQVCNTSLTATAIRYAGFAEDPVAVILSGGNCIEFCAFSESFSEIRGVHRLSKGDFLPEGTPTAKFNNNPNHAGSCDSDAAFVSLDDWFEDAPQIEIYEDIIGLGGYGKTLTVLFTDKEIDASDVNDAGD
jgi:Zn-dependent peptidase ImmA (M78 family)